MESINEILTLVKTKLVDFCMESGFKLIGALLLVIIGFKLVNLFGKKMKTMKLYEKLDPTARSFMRSFIIIGLKILLVISAAIIIGIPMASMVAVIGSAGLAIGLALQGSLSNIAGGFIILVFKPFKVGDFVSTVDATGIVEAINLFYTKIVTVDNQVVMVPNSIISNQSLTDVSTKSERRVDLVFNTSYQCDVEKVKKILLDVALDCPLALKDPEPMARLNEHGVNSLGFVLRVWCKNEDYWTVYFNLMENVKKSFDENGIKIPYQQLDIHVDNKKD
ncbi:MAG: mechanosensitive ion channel [Clostridia bacterium]|nr:mechanosensitive ion channel [Clostridia bacterium]